MTNAIGTGTANLSVNVPIDERAELGRLAFRLGFKSTGHFLRALVLKGLEQEHPDAARRVKEVRRAYYGSVMLGVFLAAFVLGHDDLRRPSRRNRMEESREEVCEV